MTFVKRIDAHPAYGSADEPEATIVRCPSCNGQLTHYVNQELTPEGKLRDGLLCETSLFHNLAKDTRLEPEDCDLTCCDHKIERET